MQTQTQEMVHEPTQAAPTAPTEQTVPYVDYSKTEYMADNKVSLQPFLDMYYLEAIAFKIMVNGNEFEPRWDKLQRDVERARYGLGTFALAMRDALFLMCMGEARHSPTTVRDGGFTYAELGTGRSRESIFKEALWFDPVQNLPLLEKLFDQSWSGGGYGGPKWAEIARGAGYYGTKLTDIAFLDHVADLEHNGGVLFNKPEVSMIGLDISRPDASTLKEFLNHKRDADLVSDPFMAYAPSAAVRGMLDRVRGFLGLDPVEWGHTKRSDAIIYTPVRWGQRVLQRKVKVMRHGFECAGCHEVHSRETGVSVQNGPEAYDKSMYCRECAHRLYSTGVIVQCNNCQGYAFKEQIQQVKMLGAMHSMCAGCLPHVRTCSQCGEKGMPLHIRAFNIVMPNGEVSPSSACMACIRAMRRCKLCSVYVSKDVVMHDLVIHGQHHEICPACIKHNTRKCSACKTRVPKDWTKRVAPRIFYCQECFDKLGFTCERCGNGGYKTFAVTVDPSWDLPHYSTLCQDCKKQLLRTCTDCGRETGTVMISYSDHKLRCTACHTAHTDNLPPKRCHYCGTPARVGEKCKKCGVQMSHSHYAYYAKTLSDAELIDYYAEQSAKKQAEEQKAVVSIHARPSA